MFTSGTATTTDVDHHAIVTSPVKDGISLQEHDFRQTENEKKIIKRFTDSERPSSLSIF